MSNKALSAAASGMYAQQINIQVISNNIANINTTSFKKGRTEFKDLMYQDVAVNPQEALDPGIVENTGDTIQVGSGVKVTSTQKLFQQGELQQTGQMLDLAINGNGFFQLRKPDGSFVYTRDGSFKLSADGTLVANSGNVLEPGIAIDQEAVSVNISRDGVVSVSDMSGERVDIGNIDIVKFVNPGGLRALGDNLYSESEASGIPIVGTSGSEGFGEIHQGFLESSNVDIVEEMIAMITAQRSYEINSKTVKTVEEMIAMANNLRR